ncbi:MAG TPA: hypothetical protein VF571_09290 [Pyrinomonadaceae bacterium]|jgi:hypothetical protein
MEKEIIDVAGYQITKLSDNTFEFDNPQVSLDFYCEVGDDEVEVNVFDSTLPTKGEQDPHLAVWYADTLEEAVEECMTFTKETLKGYEWFKR